MKMKSSIAMMLAVGATALAGMTSNAHAIVVGPPPPVVIELCNVYTGGTPSGDAPWMTLTFTTISTGTVDLKVASDLKGSEDFKVVAFNFDGNASTLASVFDAAGKVGTYSSPLSITTTSGHFGLDGAGTGDGGSFNMKIEFPNGSPSHRFDGTDVAEFTITGTGITAADFDFATTDTHRKAAAHVRNTPIGEDSGKIDDRCCDVPPPPGGNVPEPASLGLLGLGAVGLLTRRRKV